jgi:hypothetical protein
MQERHEAAAALLYISFMDNKKGNSKNGWPQKD